MEVGGWVQDLIGIFVVENHPKIALNQYWYFVYHVYSVCIHCYNLLVIMICASFHVNNGFLKKNLDGGEWVGGVSYIQVLFWIFAIFITLQSP